MNLKFIGVLLFAVVAVALVSLAWPLFTTQPRPEPLTKVRDLVIGTTVGQNVAAVLGVQDEQQVMPIDPSTVASSVAQSAVTAVEKRATDVLVTHATRELVNGFNQLSPEQKGALQSIICQQ